MRRILIACIAALLVVELGTRLLVTQFPAEIRGAPWYASDTAWNVTAVAEHLRNLRTLDPAPSVVVAGSSAAGAGIDATLMSDALRASAYNGWAPGGGIDSIRDVLVEVIGSEAEPEIVVLALTARDFNDAASQQDAHAALRSSPGFEALMSDSFGATIEDRSKRVSALVRYRDVLRQPTRLADALRNKAPWDDSDIDDRGTLQRDEGLAGTARDEYASQEQAATEGFDPRTVASSLTRLLDHAQRNGPRIVLAELPLSDEYVAFLTHGERDVAHTREEMQRVAGDFGIPFVSETACGTWVDSDFADPNHLGPIGRAKMTECVTDVIAALPK